MRDGELLSQIINPEVCFPGASSSSSPGTKGVPTMSHFTVRICSSVLSRNASPLSNVQTPACNILCKSVQRRLKMYQELVDGGKDYVILFLSTEALYLVITEGEKRRDKAGKSSGL